MLATGHIEAGPFFKITPESYLSSDLITGMAAQSRKTSGDIRLISRKIFRFSTDVKYMTAKLTFSSVKALIVTQLAMKR